MANFLKILVLFAFVGCTSNSTLDHANPIPMNDVLVRKPAQNQDVTLSGDICFNSLLDRAIWGTGLHEENPIIKIEDLIQNKFSTSQKVEALKSTLTKSRSFGYDTSWEDTLIPLEGTQYPVPKSEFEDYLRALPKTPVEEMTQTNECLEKQGANAGGDLTAEQKTFLTIACGKLALGDAFQCQKGVQILYKESAPGNSCSLIIAYPKIWAKIISNKNYFMGIKAATDRLAAQILDKKITDLNLLNTLNKAYTGTGKFKKEEATDAAWNTLAILSNGAQNTDQRVIGLGPMLSLVRQLEFLSHAAGIIDFDNLRNSKQSFSLPPEIVGSCKTTKPYHFWMAAYQARGLLKKGFSQREAMMSVLTYAKAYNTQSYKGNLNLALIFEKPWNHPTVSVIRHDLILNILGSAYGAGLLENKKINIETIFQKVFDSRSKVGDLDYKKEAVPLSEDKMKSYLFWDKMLAPDSIFKIVEQEIKSLK